MVSTCMLGTPARKRFTCEWVEAAVGARAERDAVFAREGEQVVLGDGS